MAAEVRRWTRCCTIEPATQSHGRHFLVLLPPGTGDILGISGIPFLFCCLLYGTFPLSLSFLLILPRPPLPPRHPHPHLLFAEQPSPGQLLIRGRNDRCFAHQHCHLFRLSANSRCAVHIYFRGRRGSKKHTRVRTFKKKRGGGWHTRKHTSKSLSCPLQAASTTVTQDPDLNVTDLAPLVFECLHLIVSEGHRAVSRQQFSEKKSQSSPCS